MQSTLNNKIQLIGYYGNDELIACSAWTSTSRELTEEKRNRIPQMIHKLWEEGHETPFEKAIVHFLVDTEIASHIHLLKHRISSMNGESARYKELKEDKFYIPQDWEELASNGNGILATWVRLLREKSEETNILYHRCLAELAPILGRKRAKESARFFKMYNSQIEGDISFNLRSFANFLKLRNSDKAQDEIHYIANEMLNLVKNIPGEPFKHSLNAIERKIQNGPV